MISSHLILPPTTTIRPRRAGQLAPLPPAAVVEVLVARRRALPRAIRVLARIDHVADGGAEAVADLLRGAVVGHAVGVVAVAVLVVCAGLRCEGEEGDGKGGELHFGAFWRGVLVEKRVGGRGRTWYGSAFGTEMCWGWVEIVCAVMVFM